MMLREGTLTVEFSCEVRAVTAKAILVVILQGDGKSSTLPIWIPKSQLADHSEIHDSAKEGDAGSIEMSEWIAKEKGLL